MSYLSIENLSIKLGEFELKSLNLSLDQGDYAVIIGPTGSGKSILLECIIGFFRPENEQEKSGMKFFCKFLVIFSAVMLLRCVFCCGISHADAKKLTFGVQSRFRYEFQNNFNQLYYGTHPAKGAADDGFYKKKFGSKNLSRNCKMTLRL